MWIRNIKRTTICQRCRIQNVREGLGVAEYFAGLQHLEQLFKGKMWTAWQLYENKRGSEVIKWGYASSVVALLDSAVEAGTKDSELVSSTKVRIKCTEGNT